MAFEDEENEHDLRISDSALEQKKSIDAMDKRVDKQSHLTTHEVLAAAGISNHRIASLGQGKKNPT